MTRAAKKLLEEFDSLSDADRAEVAAEVLRRLALSRHGGMKTPERGEIWLVDLGMAQRSGQAW